MTVPFCFQRPSTPRQERSRPECPGVNEFAPPAPAHSAAQAERELIGEEMSYRFALLTPLHCVGASGKFSIFQPPVRQKP